MQWITENWLLLLLGGGMLAMHLFGHGKHGGKGGHARRGARKPDAEAEPEVSKMVIPKSGGEKSTNPPDNV